MEKTKIRGKGMCDCTAPRHQGGGRNRIQKPRFNQRSWGGRRAVARRRPASPFLCVNLDSQTACVARGQFPVANGPACDVATAGGARARGLGADVRRGCVGGPPVSAARGIPRPPSACDGPAPAHASRNHFKGACAARARFRPSDQERFERGSSSWPHTTRQRCIIPSWTQIGSDIPGWKLGEHGKP
jgi:hypothetical protein